MVTRHYLDFVARLSDDVFKCYFATVVTIGILLGVARRHHQNTDVVGVQQNHGECSASAALRSASWRASISASMSRVNSLSSDMPTTLRQSLIGAMIDGCFSIRL